MKDYKNKAISGFLRLREVLELIPVSKSSIWAMVKDGRFPKPVKLSPRVTCWREEDIQNYIASRSNDGGNSHA